MGEGEARAHAKKFHWLASLPRTLGGCHTLGVHGFVIDRIEIECVFSEVCFART